MRQSSSTLTRVGLHAGLTEIRVTRSLTVRYRANEIEVPVSPAFNFITYANQV